MNAFIEWVEGFIILPMKDPYLRMALLKNLPMQILSTFWGYIVQLFPYVVLGSLLGELLKFTSWTKLIYRFTSKRRVLTILFADVLGIISPLCTYGTVPVLITLYGGGVGLGPLIAFLAASSMMNPQLFIMTVGGLGWEMALLRLLAVFVFSLLCGFLTLLLPEKFVIRKKLMIEEKDECAILNRKKEPFTFKKYGHDVLHNLLFVSKMMAIGIAIATVVDILPISSYLSEVDTSSPIGIIIAAVAGIPMYACGGGTIPMLASLLSQGLSRGSAIAFMTAGPATRVTSLAAIATIFRWGFLLCYVAVLIIFSVAMGIMVG